MPLPTNKQPKTVSAAQANLRSPNRLRRRPDRCNPQESTAGPCRRRPASARGRHWHHRCRPVPNEVDRHAACFGEHRRAAAEWPCWSARFAAL